MNDDIEESLNRWKASANCENAFDWRRWIKQIPEIEFPPGWKIKVTPPFAAAVVRFRVRLPEHKNTISIYLDCYEQLGHFGEPYWEVYPYRGCTGRCAMKDVSRLLEMIADRSESDDE